MKKQATKKPVKRLSTRKTSKAKVAKNPAKMLSKPNKLSKAKKPKDDINAEIDRILAGIVENPKPIPRPKRTRNLSMKELERKIDKIVSDALKQPTRKGRR